MKRVIGFIVGIIIFYFIFQISVTFFKTSHNVEYIKEIDDKKFIINEIYSKNNSGNYYSINIKIDDKEFIFYVGNSFNKQKNIVKDIKYYQKDNLFCVYPVYIKDKVGEDLICDIDGNLYSYTSIYDKYDLKDFASELPNFVYNKKTVSTTKEKIADVYTYNENIEENEYVIIYNYKTLLKVSQIMNTEIDFSSYDVYQNIYGTLVDKYYILPISVNKSPYLSFNIIDILSADSKVLNMNQSTSTSFYVNGAVDNKLYFFDKIDLKQYMISPKDQDYELIGDSELGGKVYENGIWKDVSIYDLKNNTIFTEDFSKLAKFNYKEAFKSNRYYYFYDEKSNFYRVHQDYKESPVLLFNKKNLKEIKVVDDNIYYIIDTTLYRFNESGEIPIAERPEFKYNSTNIYSVYIK